MDQNQPRKKEHKQGHYESKWKTDFPKISRRARRRRYGAHNDYHISNKTYPNE